MFWEVARKDSLAARESFSYFTVLTYWGISFYFAVAAFYTFQYAKHGAPLVNRLPRPLQALYHLYYTTITCYPFLVTIIYWGVLFGGTWFKLEFDAFSNISQHALNSVFALFEIIFPRTNPPPFIHMLWLIIVLAMYCGLAYLTRAADGYYVYSFLDPSGGHSGRVAGYIAALAIAQIIILCLVKLAIWARRWVTESKLGMMGKFYGGRGMEQDNIDVEAIRMWTK